MRPFLLAALVLMPLAAPAQDATRLTVQGVGEVAATPDMATVTVAVTREAETAAEALGALSEATDAVLTRVAAEGVAPADVQTGRLMLEPRWEQREDRQAPRIVGYVAVTTLDIRARDLNALGGLLDAVVADGANGLEGLRFGLTEPRAGEDDARRAAFADAMAKARLYAEAAGLEVGPILSLVEGGAAFPPPGPLMQMEAARAMPIAPGELMQAVTVTLTVELAPAE
jgi:uncharacterized protein YggE